MTEVDALIKAIKADDEDAIGIATGEILVMVLKDVRRIADALERLAPNHDL